MQDDMHGYMYPLTHKVVYTLFVTGVKLIIPSSLGRSGSPEVPTTLWRNVALKSNPLLTS